jgi:hypothetical protein
MSGEGKTPDFRYRWVKFDEGGWGVFVEYDQGPHIGWWRLVAEFQFEQRARDYAEYENHLLDCFGRDDEPDPWRHGDETIPENPPEIPQSNVSVERLEQEIVDTLVAVGECVDDDPAEMPRLVQRVEGAPARGRWPLDLTGHRFGSLVAVELSDRVSQNRHRHWRCRCDCGNVIEARADHLRYGYSKSCGCERGAKVPVPAMPPPDPLSDKPCARCGAMLPLRRAKNPKAKYCSTECSAAAEKERIEARLAGQVSTPALAAESIQDQTPEPPPLAVGELPSPKPDSTGLRAAEQAEIDRFIAERGVTKLPGVGDPEFKEVKQLVYDMRARKYTRPEPKTPADPTEAGTAGAHHGGE